MDRARARSSRLPARSVPAERSFRSARAARFGLCWLVASIGCTGAVLDDAAVAAPAAPVELSRAACLSQSPVDLSIDLKAAPPSFYVNELRLGYSRGEAIFLSRPLCDMYGKALCRFVEAHEQAHHYTKTVGQQSMCAETLADCWAAAHADDEAVEAALIFFRSRRGDGGYHGEPSGRADTIARCMRRWDKPAPLATTEALGPGDVDSRADREAPPAVAGASEARPTTAASSPARPGRAFRASARAHR